MKKAIKNIAIVVIFIALLPLIMVKAIVKKIMLYNPGLLCGIILALMPILMIALFAVIVNIIL